MDTPLVIQKDVLENLDLKPYCRFERRFQTTDIKINLSNIFDKFGKIYTGLKFFFYPFYFFMERHYIGYFLTYSTEFVP